MSRWTHYAGRMCAVMTEKRTGPRGHNLHKPRHQTARQQTKKPHFVGVCARKWSIRVGMRRSPDPHFENACVEPRHRGDTKSDGVGAPAKFLSCGLLTACTGTRLRNNDEFIPPSWGVRVAGKGPLEKHTRMICHTGWPRGCFEWRVGPPLVETCSAVCCDAVVGSSLD